MGLFISNSGVPGLRIATAAVDPPNILAGAVANVDVTTVPVGTADRVIASPPVALEAGLVFITAIVQAVDTIRVRLYNPTAGAIDGASLTWTFFILEG